MAEFGELILFGAVISTLLGLGWIALIGENGPIFT